MFTRIVASIAILLAIAGWYRAISFESRARIAETQLAARERLESLAQNLESATFIKFDGAIITYSIPRTIQRDGQTFIDRLVKTATVTKETLIIGPSGTLSIEDLRNFSAGVPINIDVSTNSKGIIQAQSLFIDR